MEQEIISTGMQEKTRVMNGHSENDTAVKHQRKWVIIEDSAVKAEALIMSIIRNHPEDAIHWIYLEGSKYNPPSYVQWTHGNNPKPFSRDIISANNEWDTIRGQVYFYWCKNKEEFSIAFEEIDDSNGIILLDINIPVLGHIESINGILGDKVRGFFKKAKEHIDEPMVCVVSGAVIHTKVRRALATEDDWYFQHIYVEGAGKWEFTGRSLLKDCQDIINTSHNLWNKLYHKTGALTTFLEKMATLTTTACHNWNNTYPGNLERYKKRGTWDIEWDMPIQLRWLIEFLNYDKDEFVKLFGLKDKNDCYRYKSTFCECLKSMGNKDAHSFSIMGIALVCWAAYRLKFNNEGKGEKMFINAIKSFTDVDGARKKFITPPQQLQTLQETITRLFKFLPNLLGSYSSQKLGEDILAGVWLTDNGFAMRIKDVSPEGLNKSFDKESQKRYFKNSNERGGGDAANDILDFFESSQYCNKLLMDKIPLLGAFYSLKIYAAGDYAQNGIVLNFGNDANINQQNNHNH